MTTLRLPLFLVLVTLLPHADSRSNAAMLGNKHADDPLVAFSDDPLQIGCGSYSIRLQERQDDIDLFCATIMPRLQHRIGRNWHKLTLQNAARTKEDRAITIRFRVQANGAITDKEVTQSSGINSLDELAGKAIDASSPLPPFPASMTKQEIPVSYTFTYDQATDTKWRAIDRVIWERPANMSLTQPPQKATGFSIGLLLMDNRLTESQWIRINKDYLPQLRHSIESEWATRLNSLHPALLPVRFIATARAKIAADGKLEKIDWIAAPEDQSLTQIADGSIEGAFPYQAFPDWIQSSELEMKIYLLYQVTPEEVW